MKRRILVCGGAGFIGTNFCRHLVDNQENEVFCIDNLCTGKLSNIEPLKQRENFHFIFHDMRYPITLTFAIDEVYNFACPASPVHYQKEPIFTLETNFLGTKNALDFANKCSAKFLQASTSEVYGNPEMHPQKEHYWGHVNPVGPRACYDEGKRVAETLCVEYARKYGLNAKIIRIFNTYGPFMDQSDGRVVSNFIVSALRGQALELYGEGKQTRSFCFVDDLIRGIDAVMDSPHRGPINLGNPEEIEIRTLAQTILKLTESRSMLEIQELPVDDPLRRKPDITFAKEMLKWYPIVPLAEGLTKTIEYFESILNIG